jgi:hypothetical protein
MTADEIPTPGHAQPARGKKAKRELGAADETVPSRMVYLAI